MPLPEPRPDEPTSAEKQLGVEADGIIDQAQRRYDRRTNMMIGAATIGILALQAVDVLAQGS